MRGLANLGCIALLLVGFVTLLCVFFSIFSGNHSLKRAARDFNSAGYPVISHFTTPKLSFNDGFNYGGSNASGIVRISDRTIYPPKPSDCDSRSPNFQATEVSSTQILQTGR